MWEFTVDGRQFEFASKLKYLGFVLDELGWIEWNVSENWQVEGKLFVWVSLVSVIGLSLVFEVAAWGTAFGCFNVWEWDIGIDC